MARKVSARDKIIDAFYKECEKKHYCDLQVSEITKLAGVNRGTFYEYFDDIESINEAAQTELLADMVTTILAVTDKNPNATMEEYIEEIFDKHFSKARIFCNYADNGFIARLTNTMKPFMYLVLGLSDKSEQNESLVYFALAGVTGFVASAKKSEPAKSAKTLTKLITAMAEGI